MTPKKFKSIRQSMGITQLRLSKLIGLHERTIRRYENGELPIPRTVELLVKMISKNHD